MILGAQKEVCRAQEETQSKIVFVCPRVQTRTVQTTSSCAKMTSEGVGWVGPEQRGSIKKINVQNRSIKYISLCPRIRKCVNFNLLIFFINIRLVLQGQDCSSFCANRVPSILLFTSKGFCGAKCWAIVGHKEDTADSRTEYCHTLKALIEFSPAFSKNKGCNFVDVGKVGIAQRLASRES